jgi:hypothetical protein
MDLQHSNVRVTAAEIRQRLAESGLPPSIAKLYSQHTRLRAQQAGLAAWRSDEASLRLHDAMRLIAGGLLEKELEVEHWQNGLRRAGELLEWLSHPELNPNGLPLSLIASAVYQLAGYPARAVGLLNQTTPLPNNHSRILRLLLEANFRELLVTIAAYWSEQISLQSTTEVVFSWHNEEQLSREIHEWVTQETISALGIVCASMRWSDETRLLNAVAKLSAIADVLLHGRDPYSWLLAKLCAEVVSVYAETSMRQHLSKLLSELDQSGQEAFESYCRQAYLSSKALSWPSQIAGINRVVQQNSFALCTPTGSGKTTIAEIAILQTLFTNLNNKPTLPFQEVEPKPVVLYLVPSKALATEVETKLSQTLARFDNEKITVTSLYGGADWGPTDVWFTSPERIVLICTFEKAEALIRFAGTSLINRLKLVVIDEAHLVEFDGNEQSLRQAESRSLRVESLSTRLMTYTEESKTRIIALSAVASGIENKLSDWVVGEFNSSPVITPYRSTRQLIGRLECKAHGFFEIRYDLLDGSSLEFSDEGQSNVPYIPNSFPQMPPAKQWEQQGAEKRIRPYLFWAAMNLVKPDAEGHQQSVLISIASGIGDYAGDLLELLKIWIPTKVPKFFEKPTDPIKLNLWEQCLKSCEDYFTKSSREYQLLEMGIVLHHGKMPGLLARLLVQVIEKRIVNLVIATSTLSEGINLPFETVLIPSLRRGSESINFREFTNLVGRAGRPGFGTEGRSLVLLPQLTDGDKYASQIERAVKRYQNLIGQSIGSKLDKSRTINSSPLANLIRFLRIHWQQISGLDSNDAFLDWLEATSPLAFTETTQTKSDQPDDKQLAVEWLDSLDSILLSTVVELEEILGRELTLDELEERLKLMWHKSYAHFASEEESKLMEVYIRRGRALKENIYPSAPYRRRLYRTGLVPRSGNKLLELYPKLREHLETGEKYINWSAVERYNFVQETVRQIATIPKFEFEAESSKKQQAMESGDLRQPSLFGTIPKLHWQNVLHWWLDPKNAIVKPNVKQIPDWYVYISKTFQYRFNWALGSFIALAIDEAYRGTPYTPSLSDWPLTGLPWIVFWMKELITWGTLEPVAAYLLAKKFEITRPDAEIAAKRYYSLSQPRVTGEELLDAVAIRNWAEQHYPSRNKLTKESAPYQVKVKLLRDFSQFPDQLWRVIPVQIKEEIYWLDLAGFPLASTSRTDELKLELLENYDFRLNAEKSVVISSVYAQS